MVAVLGFLLQNTFLLAIGALIVNMMARTAVAAGNIRRARVLGTISFTCSALLAAITGAVALRFSTGGAQIVNAIFAALWLWWAIRDYRFLRLLG